MKTTFFSAIFLLFHLNAFSQKKQLFEGESAYKNKRITISLTPFTKISDDKNCILTISQKIKNKSIVLLKDTIYSSVQEIEFKDFNNDKTKDILVQNISDVRSNWTYNLYLYNSKTNHFKKVIGFDEIKNPIYNSKYNIVESHVNSGTNWLAFYKIINHKIHNYNIEITDDGSEKSEDEYQKALIKISKKK